LKRSIIRGESSRSTITLLRKRSSFDEVVMELLAARTASERGSLLPRVTILRS